MAFFSILSHPYLIGFGGEGSGGFTAQQRAITDAQLAAAEANKEKIQASYAATEKATAEINEALAEINASNESTDSKVEEIKELAAKYPDEDVAKIVAADAAVNGTTDAALGYIASSYAADSILNPKHKSFVNKAYGAIKDAEAGTGSEAAAAKALREKKLKENGDIAVLPVDATEGLSAKEVLSLTRQTHQCILTHYLQPIADHHRLFMGNEFYVANIAPKDATSPAKIILVDDTSPDSSVAPINSLTSLGKTDIDPITPAQLARLMPSLRLYKVYREGGVEVAKVEYKFSNSTDSGFLANTAPSIATGDFVMDAGYAKGKGAGIKSFNWSFIGGDPFTATRDLKATLKLFFQDSYYWRCKNNIANRTESNN